MIVPKDVLIISTICKILLRLVLTCSQEKKLPTENYKTKVFFLQGTDLNVQDTTKVKELEGRMDFSKGRKIKSGSSFATLN